MLMSTVNQAYIFLSTIYGGVIIGFIYDLYRMIRRIFRPKRFFTGLLDLLFWLTAAVISFIVLYFSNDGEIRIYHFIGFALGAVVYMLVLSPFIMGVFYWITKWVKKIAEFIFRVIRVPIRFVWNIIIMPVRFMGKWINHEKKNQENM